MLPTPLYDNTKTYEENYEKGPSGELAKSSPQHNTGEPSYEFLGQKVYLPFGIPPGPLLNSKFMKRAFEWGFDVSTYKTVRADVFPCHPFPNVLFVDASENLYPDEVLRLHASATTDRPPEKLSITNSFGVPSRKPEVWQEDVKKALGYVQKGQVLIVSFMGTVKPDQTQEEFVEDFALAGKLSAETGAKILEANLSCPNIGNEGLVCYNLQATRDVCRAIRREIGDMPLILKVGYYQNKTEIEELARIAEQYGHAIAAINTLQTEIVDEKGNQALPGKNRLKSGVCGASIKWAGIEMTRALFDIRKKYKYSFRIVGIGGVMTSDDYFEYKDAGADCVQSATGAMWNPHLAWDIKSKLEK